MSPLAITLVCLLSFALAASSDWLETMYVRAVRAFEEARTPVLAEVARERAARASVLMWLVGVVGLVSVVEFGWWTVIPEGIGLYFGTKLALR